MHLQPEAIPRAFAALAHFPAIRAAVEPALQRQAYRTSALLAQFQERPRLLAALEAAPGSSGGLVVLEGAPGSGVSSLLAALAARRVFPLWLAADAGPTGPAALYAQIVALYRPTVPLLDPTVATDPAALERILAEAAAARPPGAPITVLIDDLDPPGQPTRPGPAPLPAELPPGVALLLGCAPGAPIPYRPIAHLRLPDDDPERVAAQARALAALGCDAAWQDPLLAASDGNFLYLALGLNFLRAGAAEPAALPRGLDDLLRGWWEGLDPGGRRLAALLAAAGEPLPLGIVAEFGGADPASTLARWRQLGLVDLSVRTVVPPLDAPPDTPAGQPTLLATFTHGALAALLARVAALELATAHRDLATAGLKQAAADLAARKPGRTDAPLAPRELYLHRQLARHAALAPREIRDIALPHLVGRERLRAHERREGVAAALEDAGWELRAAADAGLLRADAAAVLRIVRATLIAGLLATRARMITPDAAAEALESGIEHGGREASLKRVLETVERIPDGLDKAVILRRLGEVCYSARMRSTAMRLLSRALDLEASPVSRAWRDSRETLQAALATAALELGAVDTALAISERIEHLERRAMVETQAVRSLLEAGDHSRAQRLARAIVHESMGAWARAEVGVALARAGDPRGAMLLDELPLETVAAWAQIELACDVAPRDEAAALRRIAALPNQGQRDRGLARLARAMATAGNDGAALAAAEQIVAVEVRVAALIDLRLSLEGLVAMLALERATRDIGAITGDDRAPLVAALAAALAALGRSDRALALARELPAGEEQDRALARVAVALAQRGDHEAAIDLVATLADEDEQAWAYDEFSRLLAVAGHWEEAAALGDLITAPDQRARAAADLAIERARAGDPVAGLAMALAVDPAVERARALTLVAPYLVAVGHEDEALAVVVYANALPGAEARGRYLAAVAAALAEHGRTERAAAVVADIRRPADHARAGAALARALAPQTPELARAVLGAALRAAAVGREEALRALELAAPALALLGGPPLLNAASAAVDEIDRW